MYLLKKEYKNIIRVYKNKYTKIHPNGLYLHQAILGGQIDQFSNIFHCCGFVVAWKRMEQEHFHQPRTQICKRLCAGGQQSRIYDQGFQLGQGSAPDAVVFIIRFNWDSASATGCLYSAGAAECHIQSAHFVFKEVVISWQVLKQLRPKCTNFP